MGAHFGFDNAEDIYQISAAFTGGYQINRMLFVGAGVAPTLNLWEAYDDEVETEFWLPIYSAIRLDFINKKVTPFIDGRIGYFLNTEDMDYSGLYIYAGAGVRLKKISLSAGYSLYSLDDVNANLYSDVYKVSILFTTKGSDPVGLTALNSNTPIGTCKIKNLLNIGF